MELGSEASEPDQRYLASILAADICNYSSLTETSESTALKVVEHTREIIQTVSSQHAGRVFHQAGDAFFVEFPSASKSLEAAQQILIEINKSSADAATVTTDIRIGLHVGDVIRQPDGNLLGHGVNVAARLQQNARRNSILASKNLVDLVSKNLRRNAYGHKLLLKNIKQPIQALHILEKPNLILRIRAFLSQNRQLVPLALACALLAAMAYGTQWSSFSDPNKSQSTAAQNKTKTVIDRRAITAALKILVDADRPIDAAVSALVSHGNFELALASLEAEYRSELTSLSRQQSLDFLHQIGALAMGRDTKRAETTYLEVKSLAPEDPIALWQLAKILKNRRHNQQAMAYLHNALHSSDLSAENRLYVEIDLALLRTDRTQAASEMANIEMKSTKEALDGPNALARYHLVRIRSNQAYTKQAVTPELLEGFAAELRDVLKTQKTLQLYNHTAATMVSLGTVLGQLGDFEGATQSYQSALEIELALERKFELIKLHSNISRHALRINDFELAETSATEAMKIGRSENMLDYFYYNWYVLARVEHMRENRDRACDYYAKAVTAWPVEYSFAGELSVYNQELGCEITSL